MVGSDQFLLYVVDDWWVVIKLRFCKMLSELGRRPMLGSNEGSFGDELEKEIGMLLREQRRQEADDRERELNIYRSGSAPPTVEGSLSAVGGLFGGAAGAPVAFSGFQG